MVIVAVLKNSSGSSNAISSNISRNDGGTMNQYHPPIRKSKQKSSISLLSIVVLFILLFMMAMLSTIFYTHYVLMHHGQQHQYLSLLPKSMSSNLHDDGTYSTCQREYQRMMSHVTTNLTTDDYDRSIAHVGNRYRLSRIIQQKLLPVILDSESSSQQQFEQRQPLTIVVCGGSITLGHGITPVTSRYSNQLEAYLNKVFPTKKKQHTVYNRGSHGADVRIHVRPVA